MHTLAGVSGGADSVAMLLMLSDRRDRGELRLTAAHFEHGIRGEASTSDAAFVRELCARLGVPLIEGGADVPALARQRGMGLEQAAREARHAFLRGAMAQCGADTIALAHHRGDQAETVLMHIARGAGLRGAAGMAERDGDIWRPLLHMTKAEILGFLRQRGQDHREDATNAELDNPRNALRHGVLPALERAYPGAEAALCRFAEIARTEDDLVRGIADDHWARSAERTPNGWRIRADGGAHLAVIRRCMARAAGLAGRCEYDVAERLVALYGATRGKLALPNGFLAERAGAHLYIIDTAIAQPPPVPLADGAALPGIGRIRLAPCEPIVTDLGPWAQVMDAGALEGAVLRCRRPGDRLRALGGPGGRLLSDVMADLHIDRPLRDFWPLLTDGANVLWAPGIRVSERAKIRPDTRAALRADWEMAPLTTGRAAGII